METTESTRPSDFSTVASRDGRNGVVSLAMPSRPGAAARALLPTAQRRKLERLEADAAAARAAALAVSDRLRELRDEIRRHEDRERTLREAPTRPGRWVGDPERGPTARTWEPDRQDSPDAIASLLVVLRQDLERLEAERGEIDEGARTCGTIAAAARRHLGLE